VGQEWTIPDWFREEWPAIAAEAVALGGVALDFVQGQGETVVVPPGWWHAVMNVRSSVAFTENYVAAVTLQSALDGAAAVLRSRSFVKAHAAAGSSTAQITTAGRAVVTSAVIYCLDLVDEDEEGEVGGVWRWLQGMHGDGVLRVPAVATEVRD